MFKKMLFGAVETKETEPEIIEIAEKLRKSGIFPELSEKEYQDALDAAIHTIQINIGESWSIEGNEKHIPWFENYYKDLGETRWERYKDYLKNQKNFPVRVIQSMQENLYKMTDLLGDPNGEPFKRKGLIVGDVQSGKTASYVGLMNLATDAKYKVIIVLTGTTNTLREQTQIRIEEGLGKANVKGVSTIRNEAYSHFVNPIYLTSRDNDFTISSKANFGASIESTNVPIVIVTKKNTSALKNIYNWLEEYSKKKNNDHIDSSLLLIDDEADFASVNTKKEEELPTAINSRIRDILELFTKSSYIGFTATPYANIFIDPNDDDEMYGQNLFPKDYIYILGESDEYVGVQSVFSDDDEIAKYRGMLIQLNIDEVETYLPLKHKKISEFFNLSPSMKNAINLFLIGNVIRDLRGDKTAHRSMLMNMSRFVNIHEQIKIVVYEYIENAKRCARLYGKLPLNEALQCPILAEIKESYDAYYSGQIVENYRFSEILKYLNDSIYRIKIVVVNSNNKELDYLQNETDGERVIVIGGFALSRGLTLEGLMISYYYRNSVMYDSLLQMGRWFGYRNGYDDLCKIFMTSKAISDFKFIALATQELKDDLEINSKRGLTPKQFGIKVRSGQVGLIITARSKMRTGENRITRADFTKDILETRVFTLSEIENRKNYEVISKFIEENKSHISNNLYPQGKKESKFRKGLINIDKSKIIEFLKNYIPVRTGGKFDSELIIKWLRNSDDSIIQTWDVGFVGGDEQAKFNYGNEFKSNALKRAVDSYIKDDDIFKVNHARLGTPADGRYGLSENQVELVKSLHRGNKSISQTEYFGNDLKRKPILLIYSLIPYDSENPNKSLIDRPIPLISIGIPEFEFGKSNIYNYTVNQIYRDFEELEMEDE